MFKEHCSEGPKAPSSTNPNGIDPFTEGFVRKSARQLAGKFGFKRQDRDEIEQRLYLKLAKHLHAADPNDPKWKAFVATTVRRHIATMIRDNQAEKRDHRRVRSIHVTIGTADGPAELAATVSASDVPSRRAGERRSEQELTELRIDVTDGINSLGDEKQQDFCERAKQDSISQVARDLDIPRTTVDAWRGKLRCRFEDRGLKEYL